MAKIPIIEEENSEKMARKPIILDASTKKSPKIEYSPSINSLLTDSKAIIGAELARLRIKAENGPLGKEDSANFARLVASARKIAQDEQAELKRLQSLALADLAEQLPPEIRELLAGAGLLGPRER